MTNFDWLDGALCAMIGAQKDYKAEWGWNRYMLDGKLFAATCCPGETHAPEYAGHPLLTLKCDPLESEFLREQYPDILPGFYCDKRNWISIRLDSEVPQELVHHLCEASYKLIFAKLTKKRQRELNALEENHQ